MLALPCSPPPLHHLSGKAGSQPSHFLNIILFIFLLGVCCHVGFSLVAVRRGYSRRSVWASHCAGVSCCKAQALGLVGFSNSGSQALEHRLSACGARAQMVCSMWDLPRSVIKPCLLHWQTDSTTEPPGNPHAFLLLNNVPLMRICVDCHFLTTLNIAAVNTYVPVFCVDTFFPPLSIHT